MKMFLTMEEAKAKLNLSEDEVQSFVIAGKLNEFREDKKQMFKCEQVEELLREFVEIRGPVSEIGQRRLDRIAKESEMEGEDVEVEMMDDESIQKFIKEKAPQLALNKEVTDTSVRKSFGSKGIRAFQQDDLADTLRPEYDPSQLRRVASESAVNFSSQKINHAPSEVNVRLDKPIEDRQNLFSKIVDGVEDTRHLKEVTGLVDKLNAAIVRAKNAGLTIYVQQDVMLTDHVFVKVFKEIV